MTTEKSTSPILVSNWTLETGREPGRRAHLAVVVASGGSDDHLMQAALAAEDCDIVFVESSENAYSRIKRIVPNLVVVCLEMDDVAGFRVLSMLNLDSATSQIPVVTYIANGEARSVECDAGSAGGRGCRGVTASSTH